MTTLIAHNFIYINISNGNNADKYRLSAHFCGLFLFLFLVFGNIRSNASRDRYHE